MNSRLARILLWVLVIVVLMIGPFAGAQEGPSITVNLTPYEGNPILTVGEEGAWDARGVGEPRVIYADGVFYMFYSGWLEDSSRQNVAQIGYATSEDGLHWTRYAENPIFALDPPEARDGVLGAAVMLDGETWVIFFTPSIETGRPAETVLRATAPSPTGPWTVDPEPVLALGTTKSWDRNGLGVSSILQTDEGYVLYYTSMGYPTGDGTAYIGGDIGMAISPDGLQWTEYNDPTTTSRNLAERDPVFLENPDNFAWDSYDAIGPVVRLSDDGWEMFYCGSSGGYYSLGYATSENGITWTRYRDAPILSAPNEAFGPGSVVVIDNTYYLYYTHYVGNTDTMQIEVATGTITRE